jgi:hypothetical protein
MIKSKGIYLVRVCLFLFVAVTIGISPAFAQAPEAKTLDLGLASDDELTDALNKAGDIELINKEDSSVGTAAPAKAAPAGQETTSAGKTGGDSLSGDDYLEESRRLVKLAEEAFSEADYDKSAMLADEAAFLAEDAASAAAQQLEKPGSIGSPSPNASPGTVLSLPATYTVRPWAVSKDCFWNIAGFPWVYGDPHQWRLLYNANKSKLPNPNNPNVIEPGTVLDIPSIKGEVRQGAWESGRTYEALK